MLPHLSSFSKACCFQKLSAYGTKYSLHPKFKIAVLQFCKNAQTSYPNNIWVKSTAFTRDSLLSMLRN